VLNVFISLEDHSPPKKKMMLLISQLDEAKSDNDWLVEGKEDH